MVKLYSDQISGNCYKLRLLLTQLEIPFEVIETKVLKGEQRTDEFRERNPNAKVPIVQLDDGNYLSESNAILYHFGEGTRYWPPERIDRSRAMQWMFFEQYTHEPNIAVARFWQSYGTMGPEQESQMPKWRKGGEHALGVMEQHLSKHHFFAGADYSIADIALYAYTHVAHEGGFDLERYPAIRAWIERVASQPRHVTIEHVC